MAINSPFGANSIFDPSFEWMGDKKKDDNKKQYKYLNIKYIGSEKVTPYNNAYVSFVFEVEAENIIDTNAVIKVFEHSQFGLLLEKGKTVTNINKKGKTNITVTLKMNLLLANPSTDYSATIECDGMKISTVKFKIDNNSSEKSASQPCGNQYKGLTKCVHYHGKYGPYYNGSQKMISYKYFEKLILDNIITSDEKDIIIVMSENEGNLDAIQSFDSEILSGGAMQKTVNSNGGGEFPEQLLKFKTRFPKKYLQIVNNCNWEVRTDFDDKKNPYKIYYQTLTGEQLKLLIRKGFDKSNVGKKVDSTPLLSLIGLLRDKDFQSIQIEDFIERLNKALSKKPLNYSYPIYSYTISKLGKALVLDHDINRPAHVPLYFGEALNRLYKKNPSIPKNPMEWNTNHIEYENKLLEIYGPIRDEKLTKIGEPMTDGTKRYNNLKKRL